eukprot:tig00020603_g11762.t1
MSASAFACAALPVTGGQRIALPSASVASKHAATSRPVRLVRSSAAAAAPAASFVSQRSFMGQSLRPAARGAAAAPAVRVSTCAAASSPAIEQAKKKVLDLIAPVQRGLTATKEDEAAIEQAVRELEALNPTSAPTASPEIEGDWELVYTTSESIIGRTRPDFLRPKGPIYQRVRLADTSVENSETIAPLPFLKITNKVRATFTVDGPVRVQVKFNEFEIGGAIRFKAGENARGFLETTFLDGSMRVSRGNRNNLFVLTK